MNKKNKKTKEQTTFNPASFENQAQAEEAAEEYLKNKPFYTVINIFIGDAKVKTVKSDVDGKPPYY